MKSECNLNVSFGVNVSFFFFLGEKKTEGAPTGAPSWSHVHMMPPHYWNLQKCTSCTKLKSWLSLIFYSHFGKITEHWAAPLKTTTFDLIVKCNFSVSCDRVNATDVWTFQTLLKCRRSNVFCTEMCGFQVHTIKSHCLLLTLLKDHFDYNKTIPSLSASVLQPSKCLIKVAEFPSHACQCCSNVVFWK